MVGREGLEPSTMRVYTFPRVRRILGHSKSPNHARLPAPNRLFRNVIILFNLLSLKIGVFHLNLIA
jgi:hypothetical protein